MNLDDLLREYFGTDPSKVSLAAQEAGVDRIGVDFGLASDCGLRVAGVRVEVEPFKSIGRCRYGADSQGRSADHACWQSWLDMKNERRNAE